MKNSKDDQKTNQKTKKRRLWIRMLLLIIAAAVLMLGPRAYDAAKNDPNLILKKVSKTLTTDDKADVRYRYKSGKEGLFSLHRIPIYAFTPEESGDYTFSVSDAESEKDVFLSLQVTDSHLNNFLSTDNMESRDGSFSDTVFLNEGSVCYILIDTFSEEDREVYSGSFSFIISKAAEVEGPAQITETGSAVIKLSEDSQTSVLFCPEESGYFRFDSAVVSGDKTASTYISSVKTGDNEEIKRFEGICFLEGGREYYVWVSAQDMTEESVKAEVSCNRVDSLSTDQTGEYMISGDTVIEFTAQETKNLAVYSVSDGNARGSVYDSNGFPLNSDEGSGGKLSGNEGDFALVIQAQKKNRYLIYTGGRFDECKIVITEYTGDGSSLGKDDVVTITTEEQENDEAGTESDETGDGSQ